MIVFEIKKIETDRDMYQTKVNFFSCKQDFSPPLAECLSYMSPDLSEETLPAIGSHSSHKLLLTTTMSTPV